MREKKALVRGSPNLASLCATHIPVSRCESPIFGCSKAVFVALYAPNTQFALNMVFTVRK